MAGRLLFGVGPSCLVGVVSPIAPGLHLWYSEGPVQHLKHQPALPDLPIRRVQDMGLKELERIRLILRGGSVIEWRRLHFTTWDEVDRFLRLCQIDPTRAHDEEWVRHILGEAVEYLRRTFNYRVADAVANPNMIHDLFLYASGQIDKKYRKIACVVLKVMHVIQHIEARDLLFNIAVSEAELSQMVTDRVLAVLEEAKSRLPIVSYSDSIKTRESVITKLVAKKEYTAATVYDRTRFRVIVKDYDDIIPTLYFLTQRLIPFNFIVPAQSDNTLIRFKDLVGKYPNFRRYARHLHLDLDYEEREHEVPYNAFSGSTYRVLNFVADVPIRLDAFLPAPERDDRPRRCRITLATCEFQISDETTAVENERGENSHERYKARQRAVVLKRLSRGLVVPRRRRTGEIPRPVPTAPDAPGKKQADAPRPSAPERKAEAERRAAEERRASTAERKAEHAEKKGADERKAATGERKPDAPDRKNGDDKRPANGDKKAGAPDKKGGGEKP